MQGNISKEFGATVLPTSMLNVNNALDYVQTGVQKEADETVEEGVDIQVL